jgi:GTP-binding protein
MMRRWISRCFMPAAEPAPLPGRWKNRGPTSFPVFEALLKHVPAPHGDPEKSLQMQITSIQYNDYVGRIGVGRIYNGRIKTGQQVKVVRARWLEIKSKVQQVQVVRRPGPQECRRSQCRRHRGSDRLGIGGYQDSICDPINPQPLEAEDVEPPTLTMMFSVNDSPFVGKEGKYVTSRNLARAALQGIGINVALKVKKPTRKTRSASPAAACCIWAF